MGTRETGDNILNEMKDHDCVWDLRWKAMQRGFDFPKVFDRTDHR
jgi:hypothetical protein